jgi:hypothetical protein
MKNIKEFINEANFNDVKALSRRTFDEIIHELETEWEWNIYDMADNYNRTPEEFIVFLASKK